MVQVNLDFFDGDLLSMYLGITRRIWFIRCTYLRITIYIWCTCIIIYIYIYLYILVHKYTIYKYKYIYIYIDRYTVGWLDDITNGIFPCRCLCGFHGMFCSNWICDQWSMEFQWIRRMIIEMYPLVICHIAIENGHL